MNRNERNTIHDLFRSTHRQRGEKDMSAQWRHGIMAEIRLANTRRASDILDRLAPRLTLAATALCVAGLAIGVWSIPQLANDIQNAYTAQLYDMTSDLWTLL